MSSGHELSFWDACRQAGCLAPACVLAALGLVATATCVWLGIRYPFGPDTVEVWMGWLVGSACVASFAANAIERRYARSNIRLTANFALLFVFYPFLVMCAATARLRISLWALPVAAGGVAVAYLVRALAFCVARLTNRIRERWSA